MSLQTDGSFFKKPIRMNITLTFLIVNEYLLNTKLTDGVSRFQF